jgi:hypothetical protein
MTLRLSYPCLEEGISLCERISEYELLSENSPPQAIVAAVFVWLVLLVSDVDVKSLRDESLVRHAESAENISPDKSAKLNYEKVLEQTLWPPLFLESIAEECYTTVAAIKNIILRLFASMKVLLLLPASGAERDDPKPSGFQELNQNITSRNPPAKIHQRFAHAFERFQEAIAIQSAGIVTSPTVNSPGTGKKRKRPLSTGQSIHSAGAFSSGSGGSELALSLDRLLSGEGENHFIRSPIWKDTMQLNVASPPSVPTSRVSSFRKLSADSNTLLNRPHILFGTKIDSAPAANKYVSRQEEIQQLSQGLFMSQRKRFKAMTHFR